MASRPSPHGFGISPIMMISGIPVSLTHRS